MLLTMSFSLPLNRCYGPINGTRRSSMRLGDLMLVFRGLVTKDDIWIRVKPNNMGYYLRHSRYN